MEIQEILFDLNKKIDLIIFLLKVQNKNILSNEVKANLGNKQKIDIYELTDGLNTARDIAKLTGISKTTVTNCWKEWLLSGFAIPEPKRDDRPIKIFSKNEILELLNI